MSIPSHDGWTRCPPGTFRRLAVNLAARRVRQLWLTGLGWAAAALVAAAVTWQAADAVAHHYSGGSAGGSGCGATPCGTSGPCPTPATQPAAK
jgi:hypothetical protein